ncbi:MAG: hypothetical protein J6T51_01360, partial [Kiritimatiellae bacterium]|nr:hypothetical protein [Kiritimatiellia bacterium]
PTSKSFGYPVLISKPPKLRSSTITERPIINISFFYTWKIYQAAYQHPSYTPGTVPITHYCGNHV